MRFWFAAPLLLASAPACAPPLDDPRAAEVAAVLARADEPLIRARPALVAGKYAAMAADPFAFYRGSVPLFLHDWRLGTAGLPRTELTADPLLPLGLGDPHPENFGILRGVDGTFALEPNDFDAADRVPWLWDVRRLAIGLVLFARLSNPDDAPAREAAAAAAGAVALAAAEAYAEATTALAAGAPPARITDDFGEPVLDDLFRRSRRDTDERAELQALTVLEGSVRRLRRGVLDPEDPNEAFADLPPSAYEALPAALAAYRGTLLAPPPPGYFTLLDAAREFGGGIASWPRVRAILLVRGPTDDPADDVVLEIKEIPDTGIGGWIPPGVAADSVPERILLATRTLWSAPAADPLWGVTTWMGFPCQVRTESEGQKTLRLRRIEEERGTPEALTQMARRLGGELARIHAQGLAGGEGVAAGAARVAAAIGPDPAAFADEQARVAERYAAQVLVDAEAFAGSLAELGPTLGVPIDPADRPPPDQRALFGTPPTP